MAGTLKVELDRLKASRSAAGYDPEDLPGALADADAAVRMGKSTREDVILRVVESADEILGLEPGQVLAVVGKSEVEWAATYHRQRVGRSSLDELLSFARQVIVARDDGLKVRHAGHPGEGPHHPILVDAPDDLAVSVQPGDLLLRFDNPDLTLEEFGG